METRNPVDTADFVLVDVFADRPLEGNPVAIVPDAARLSEAQMQRVAREFNQSETVFVLPATIPSADWRLLGYTAAGKMASGAGHHTLGTWWWLAESGALKLDEGSNRFRQQDADRVTEVSIARESGQLIAVEMMQQAPIFGATVADGAVLAEALGLTLDDVATDLFAPQVVSTGAAHLLVPLRDRTAVDRAVADNRRMLSVLQSVEGEGCYLFTRDTVNSAAIAYARFFNPTLGITEDVATGTAAGPLAAQFVAHGLSRDGATVHIEQGHTLGRPSRIQVRVSGASVTISGRCVTSGKGTLRIV